jgi:heme o synthase
MYRDDYARGGYRMLPSADPDGRRTGRWIVGYSIVLVAVSLSPWALHYANGVYAVVAIVLGAALTVVGWGVLRERSEAGARRMLLASIVYLPILFLLLWINRIGG